MKKLASILALVSLFFSAGGVHASTGNIKKSQDQYFIVTAYYSPLPNQKYYIRGNLRDEKILQGHGIRGASGRKVFSGMLAAPGKYNFGTKIYLEGLGIGAVEDRGGAIVQAGKRGFEHDRIDVWMGYGDEGLKRAMMWGKRKVKGRVISPNSRVTINYKNHPAPDYVAKGYERKDVFSLFYYDLGIGSNPAYVKQLQIYLRNIGLYKGKIDGIYNSEVIRIIYSFQLRNKLIQPGKKLGAGYWSASTRYAFYKQYGNGKTPKKTFTQRVAQKPKVLAKKATKKYVAAKKVIQKKWKKPDIFSGPLETIEEKKKLLSMFTELGKSNYSHNSVFSEKLLIDTVYKFQLENKIVTSTTDLGAGNFGPKTRVAFKKIYTDFKNNQKQELLRKQQVQKQVNAELKKYILYSDLVKKGDIGVDVRTIQKALNILGYFDRKDTGYFGDVTAASVAQFQLDTGVIPTKQSKYAGLVGKETKKVIDKKLAEFYTQKFSK